MIENVVERAIVPHNPSAARVLNKDKYNLFAPVAGPGKVGMASFDARYFTVRNQEVSLKDGVIPQVIEEPADATDKNVFSAAYILSLSIAIENDLNTLGDRMTAAELIIDEHSEVINENVNMIDELFEDILSLGRKDRELNGKISSNADDIATNAADIEYNASNIIRINNLLAAQEDINRSVEHRLDNLEIGTLDTVEMSGEAYAVNVPSEALPWASVDKIGGKTRVELTETNGVIADGGATLNGVLSESPTFYNCNVNTDTVECDDYTVVIDVLGGSYSGGTVRVAIVDSDSIGVVLGAYVPNAVGRYVFAVDASSIRNASFMPVNGTGQMAVRAEGVTFNDFRFNIRLYEGVIFEFVSTPVTAVKAVGKNLLTSSALTAGGWTNYSGVWWKFDLDLPNGTYVMRADIPEYKKETYIYITKSVNGGSFTTVNSVQNKDGVYQNGQFITDNGVYISPCYFVVTDEVRYRLQLYNDNTGYPNAIETMQSILDMVKNWQIERVDKVGDPNTAYAPYTETTYPIPEAVQELAGYGRGLSASLFNYLDPVGRSFTRMVGSRAYQEGDYANGDVLTNGVTTIYPLASPVVVDLGDMLSDDSYIETEPNGWIFLINESESAVPYAITYQKTKGA